MIDDGHATSITLIIILDKWQKQFYDCKIIITSATYLNTKHVMLQEIRYFEMATLKEISHLTGTAIHKLLTPN